MNEKLNAYIENLKKERVAVLGLGISNAALLRFLKEFQEFLHRLNPY